MQSGFSAVQASCTRERLGELSLGQQSTGNRGDMGKSALCTHLRCVPQIKLSRSTTRFPEQSENPNRYGYWTSNRTLMANCYLSSRTQILRKLMGSLLSPCA